MSFNLETYYEKITEYIKKHEPVNRKDLEIFIIKTLKVKEPYRVIMNLKKHGIIMEHKIISLKGKNNGN